MLNNVIIMYLKIVNEDKSCLPCCFYCLYQHSMCHQVFFFRKKKSIYLPNLPKRKKNLVADWMCVVLLSDIDTITHPSHHWIECLNQIKNIICSFVFVLMFRMTTLVMRQAKATTKTQHRENSKREKKGDQLHGNICMGYKKKQPNIFLIWPY